MSAETVKFCVRYSDVSRSREMSSEEAAIAQAAYDDRRGPIPIAIVRIAGGQEKILCDGAMLSSAIKRWRDAHPNG